MRPGLGNEPQVGNVDGPFQLGLVRGVEDRIERYLGQDLVYAELVRIEHHLASIVTSAKPTPLQIEATHGLFNVAETNKRAVNCFVLLSLLYQATSP